MRWSCPHCGTSLATSDEKLNSGWSFSKCYSCSGFALVRLPQVNVIKVDQAPTGEKVLLPEAHEEPRLSQSAIQNMASRLNSKNSPAPEVRPAKPMPQSIQQASNIVPTELKKNNFLAQTETPVLPEPLPKLESKSWSNRILPLATVIAGIAAVVSGVYLFTEGQALYKKARNSTGVTNVAPKDENTNSLKTSSQETLKATGEQTSAFKLENNVEVRQAALSAVEPGPHPLQPLLISVKGIAASFHDRPGSDSNIVGTAKVGQKYVVLDWSDQWFKVQVSPSEIQSAGPLNSESSQSAWVRSDVVETVRSVE